MQTQMKKKEWVKAMESFFFFFGQQSKQPQSATFNSKNIKTVIKYRER